MDHIRAILAVDGLLPPARRCLHQFSRRQHHEIPQISRYPPNSGSNRRCARCGLDRRRYHVRDTRRDAGETATRSVDGADRTPRRTRPGEFGALEQRRHRPFRALRTELYARPRRLGESRKYRSAVPGLTAILGGSAGRRISPPPGLVPQPDAAYDRRFRRARYRLSAAAVRNAAVAAAVLRNGIQRGPGHHRRMGAADHGRAPGGRTSGRHAAPSRHRYRFRRLDQVADRGRDRKRSAGAARPRGDRLAAGRRRCVATAGAQPEHRSAE